MVLVSNRPASVLLNEAMLSDITDAPNAVSSMRAEKHSVIAGVCHIVMKYFLVPCWAQVDGDESCKAEGYGPVNTKEQELKPEEADSRAGPPEDANQSTKAKAALSATQLLLRRGATVLVLLLLLITGVAFHLAFPAPEPSGRTNGTLLWVNVSTPTALTPLDFVTPGLVG